MNKIQTLEVAGYNVEYIWENDFNKNKNKEKNANTDRRKPII